MQLKVKLMALAGISVACQPEIKNEDKQPPNILFIMSDDHAWQALSAYGGPLAAFAPTPNIDRIARDGMRFERCLVTNSISGPSRACILTGKYSHKNGFIANEDTPFDGSQQTFPKLLRQAGYQTAIIGKWHLDSKPTGFDYWNILNGQGEYYNPDFITGEDTTYNTGYVTELITEATIDWLEKAKDKNQPFMLMMHHKAPHRHWRPGPEELDYYKGIEFPEPATLFDDYKGRGRAEKEQDMTIAETMRIGDDLKMWNQSERNQALTRLLPSQRRMWDSVYNVIYENYITTNPKDKELVKWKYQRFLQDYLACITAVDKSVGEILDYLKEKGLDKNTIVVYTSDQGFYLGEHGWFDKRFMFEESYRTPLLISWPGIIEPGSVNNDMVSNLDFAETFLAAAGTDIPADMQGESMLPILKGDTTKDWRKTHYYHYYGYPDYHSVKRHYGISTPRYKLIHYYYDIDEWELYDMVTDPSEMKNEYDNPKYKNIRADLHKELEGLMLYYGDSDSLAHTFLPNLGN